MWMSLHGDGRAPRSVMAKLDVFFAQILCPERLERIETLAISGSILMYYVTYWLDCGERCAPLWWLDLWNVAEVVGAGSNW